MLEMACLAQQMAHSVPRMAYLAQLMAQIVPAMARRVLGMGCLAQGMGWP